MESTCSGGLGPCRPKPFEIRRAVSGERPWSGNAAGYTPPQPLPENRVGGDLTGFAEKISKHVAGEVRLAPGGEPIYSAA